LIGYRHSLNKNSYKAQFCCSSAVPTYSYMVTQDFAQNPAPVCGGGPLGTFGCGPFPNSWTWDNPGLPEDITFRMSKKTTNPSGDYVPGKCTTGYGNYNDRAPGQRTLMWARAQHGAKGGIANSGAEYGKIQGETLYMNIGGEGIKNMSVVLADLEGEEPNAKFRYSTVLIDKTTGQVITNPNPPPECTPDTIVNPSVPQWPDVSDTLWHFEAPLSTGGVTDGVGSFAIGVDNFLNHPDSAVKAGFEAQLAVLGSTRRT